MQLSFITLSPQKSPRLSHFYYFRPEAEMPPWYRLLASYPPSGAESHALDMIMITHLQWWTVRKKKLSWTMYQSLQSSRAKAETHNGWNQLITNNSHPKLCILCGIWKLLYPIHHNMIVKGKKKSPCSTKPIYAFKPTLDPLVYLRGASEATRNKYD